MEIIKDAIVRPLPEAAQNETITVGIACYNIERYISRCLESVLAQTYGNLEIIAVDDGSTDTTGQILDAYAEKDSRLRVIHQENRGRGGARNAVLDQAGGDYITFVDGDDFILPQMYEAMLSALRDTDAAACVCRYSTVSRAAQKPPESDSAVRGTGDRQEPPETASAVPGTEGPQEPPERTEASSDTSLPLRTTLLALTRDDAMRLLVEEDERYPVQNAVWNKLYRRSVAGTLRMPEHKRYEDIVYTAKMLWQTGEAARLSEPGGGCDICYIDTPFYQYIIDRSDSIMNRGVTEAILTDQIPAYEDREDFLRKNADPALVWAHLYLVYKKLLLLYTEARRAGQRQMKHALCGYLKRAGEHFEEVYSCAIAQPHEKLRMRLFLIHPFLYDVFMDLNEGVVLPLRRRLSGK